VRKGERDIDFILSGSLYDEGDIKRLKVFRQEGSQNYSTRYAGLFRKGPVLKYASKQGSESCLHILDLKVYSHIKKKNRIKQISFKEHEKLIRAS
jgi:hypothetical protein